MGKPLKRKSDKKGNRHQEFGFRRNAREAPPRDTPEERAEKDRLISEFLAKRKAT